MRLQGSYIKNLTVVHYPSHTAVKDALLDGTLDAVLGSGVLTESGCGATKDIDHTDKVTVSLTEAIMNRIIVMNTAKTPTDDLQTHMIIHAVDKASISSTRSSQGWMKLLNLCSQRMPRTVTSR